MTLESKEDRFVTLIEGAVTDAQVEPYPDDPEGFRPTKNKCILVAFNGKRVVGTSNNRGTKQLEEDTFVVRYLYKNRRTHQGVLADMQSARDGLSGDKIDGNFIRSLSWSYRGYDPKQKRWIYDQQYKLANRYDNR